MSKIKPLNDFIVVGEPLTEQASASGLIVISSAVADTQRCEVLAVGPGEETAAGLVPIAVPVGSIVYLPKEVVSSAPSLKVDGRTVRFIKPQQVLCWAEDASPASI